MIRKLMTAAAIAGTAFCAPQAFADGCSLTRYATLDIALNKDGRYSTQASLDGTSFNMLIDTGSPVSVFSEPQAKTLGLEVETLPGAGNRYEVFGGYQVRHYAAVENLILGQTKLDKGHLLVVPQDIIGTDYGGILGADILYNFDLDFDYGAGKLNLFSPDHCDGHVVYWTQTGPLAIVPFTFDESTHMVVDVSVDGKETRAIVDTGSDTTVMSLEEAESLFGLTETSPGMAHADRKGGKDGTVYRYAFRTLDLGGVTVQNPNILLMPDAAAHLFEPGGPQMMVGITVLRQLHLYVAYRENKLYITAASAH